jgi:hypothetical protein
VLLGIQALNFDFDNGDCGAAGDLAPSIPRDGKRVNAIGNHGAAQAKVVLCQHISDAIAVIVKGPCDSVGAPENLLN